MEDIRGSLRQFADQVRKTAPKCATCGLPESGPIPVVGGVSRGTFHAGERFLNAGARPLSRARAGLCQCWTIQMGIGADPPREQVADHRQATHHTIDIILHQLDQLSATDTLGVCLMDILHALQDHAPGDGVFYRRIETGGDPFTFRLAPVHKEAPNVVY